MELSKPTRDLITRASLGTYVSGLTENDNFDDIIDQMSNEGTLPDHLSLWSPFEAWDMDDVLDEVYSTEATISSVVTFALTEKANND